MGIRWAIFFPTLVVACDYNNGPNDITSSSKDFQYLLLSKKILTCVSEVVINTIMNRKENVNYRIIYTHGAGDWRICAATIFRRGFSWRQNRLDICHWVPWELQCKQNDDVMDVKRHLTSSSSIWIIQHLQLVACHHNLFIVFPPSSLLMSFISKKPSAVPCVLCASLWNWWLCLFLWPMLLSSFPLLCFSVVPCVLCATQCPPCNILHEIDDFASFYDLCYYPHYHASVFATRESTCASLLNGLQTHSVRCDGRSSLQSFSHVVVTTEETPSSPARFFHFFLMACTSVCLLLISRVHCSPSVIYSPYTICLFQNLNGLLQLLICGQQLDRMLW